ncbi:hypothetical protein V9T40_002363 [Parthenolecanium corni]|uniref:CCHC-type domain-containing protein n=1 Tax=Parthenolecanium corni TaxID=536013 RepID=A0AAN9TGL0_9HEMI
MYQEQIIELENPREMLDKLHKMKREEINDTTVSVKDQLQNLKFQLGVDTVFNFNTKFDDLVRRYELVSEMKMSEQDKKDAYYHIISKSVPSVKEATYRDRANEEGDSFTFDQMRIYIQQIEAENKSISQGPRGRGGFMMASAGSAASRCFKCGDRGHYSSSCRRRQGDVKCYRCDGFDHESFEYANNANRLARHGKRTNNISCGGSKRSKPNSIITPTSQKAKVAKSSYFLASTMWPCQTEENLNLIEEMVLEEDMNKESFNISHNSE